MNSDMFQKTLPEELKTSTGKTFLKIKTDLADNWVYTDWIGYPTPENVAKGALAYLDTLKANNLNAVLNDNRNLVGRWDQSLDWVKQVWLPYAVKSGLKRFAHVAPKDALSIGAAVIMQEYIKSKVEMQVFSNLEEAKVWLRVHDN